NTAKVANIEPKVVSKNLYIQTAYNSQHQLQVAKEIAHLIENNSDIKLIIINNLTKFFRDSRAERRLETASTVKEVISIINRACVKNKISIVVTGDSNLSSKGIIPRPIGGTYLKHIANVIVYLKNISASAFLPRFKATLVKHQYIKTPKSIFVHGRKCGRAMLLN
ncbi:MAG: hypothetical protein WA421_01625, partial [Nitrososphaeraceae archaeon]